MSLRRSVTIAAVSLALLTGCSHDDPEKSEAAAPIAEPSAGALTAGVLPGESAAATGGPTAAGATTKSQVRPTPSRPAGLPTPDVHSLLNAWITATVTRGGSGPCFGLTAADGVTYATYSKLGITLTTGARVRARITPGATPVNCGSGKPARLVHVQLAG